MLKPKVNTKEIRKRMIDLDVSYEDLAQAIGKKAVTIRQKINNYRPLFVPEAEVIQQMLEIPDKEYGFYFYSRLSHGVNKCD